jgi:PAS domain S-box-containing protein
MRVQPHRPDDLSRIEDALAEAQCRSNVWNADYKVMPPPGQRRAGQTRWIAVESSIVRDPQGTLVGLLGVTRDITERKRADQALADVKVQRFGRTPGVPRF